MIELSLNFNTDESGDKHVIVFTREAFIDTEYPPAHEVPVYFEKYRAGIARLEMTPEVFSRDDYVAIRIRPTEVRGWE